MPDRPELIYGAAGRTLLLARGVESDELALTCYDETLGRIQLVKGLPTAVEAGPRRWRVQRAGRSGWRYDAVDAQSAEVACRYRGRPLRAGGRMVPSGGIEMRLAPRSWLRRRWTLRFEGGRVAVLEPLGPEFEPAIAIEVRQAVRGLPDAALVVLFAAVVVWLEFEMASYVPGGS